MELETPANKNAKAIMRELNSWLYITKLAPLRSAPWNPFPANPR